MPNCNTNVVACSQCGETQQRVYRGNPGNNFETNNKVLVSICNGCGKKLFYPNFNWVTENNSTIEFVKINIEDLDTVRKTLIQNSTDSVLFYGFKIENITIKILEEENFWGIWILAPKKQICAQFDKVNEMIDFLGDFCKKEIW